MYVDTINIRRWEGIPYERVWREMVEFSRQRDGLTQDEIWIVEHEPVFTLGQAAERSHILDAHDIPVYETDRGGEVTYHGPGQLVIYLLIDLKRRFGKVYVRELVFRIEEAIIRTLSTFHIVGERRKGAPGVYIPRWPVYAEQQGAKIAALGLKIQGNGCMYHGLALNVAMDLQPFQWIDPCGYRGLAVTDMRSLGFTGYCDQVYRVMLECLSSELGFRLEIAETGEVVCGG